MHFWFTHKEETRGLTKDWKIALEVWDCVNMVTYFAEGMCT